MIDIALLFLASQLLKGESTRASPQSFDVPIDAGLINGSDFSVSGAPKPIKEVDDTQVRPRGRFGL